MPKPNGHFSGVYVNGQEEFLKLFSTANSNSSNNSSTTNKSDDLTLQQEKLIVNKKNALSNNWLLDFQA